jgi:hypothetical protein
MKKLSVLFAFLFVVGLCAGVANASPTQLNYRGSLLVFPLMDNINAKTIIEVANTSPNPVTIEGFVVAHPPADEHDFVKLNFIIELTGYQKWWWETYTNTPGLDNWDNMKGFIVLWAVNNASDKLEIAHDRLMGEAVIYTNPAPPSLALQYNAIPHQALSINPDRQLQLDNSEYTASTDKIFFEGFSGGYWGIEGILAVALLDIDFIWSIQPSDDLTLQCWDEEEDYIGSRHLPIYQFRQWPFSPRVVDGGLQLDLVTVTTPKFWCVLDSELPLWAVVLQYTGEYAWGTNVWHDWQEAYTTIVLPDPPPPPLQ